LKTNLLGDDAGRQTFRTVLHQQSKDRQAMLVSKSAQGCNGFSGLHGLLRYYEDYRNVNWRCAASREPGANS
jgi:hypothetical protein